MLKSISLTNWRSHSNTRILFARGANILVGPMGSGKSSITDALCFALYGTYPKLGRKEVKIEEIGNFRHKGQIVAVEIEWDDAIDGEPVHHYKARREIGGKMEAWFYCDGKLMQKGQKAVTQEVEKALGISYELFSRAVYSEQNRLDLWLTMQPSIRKAELDRLLGLDRFEKARAAATFAYNKAKEKAAAIDSKELEKKLEADRKALEQLQSQLLKRKGELEEKKALWQNLETEFAKADKLWKEAEFAKKQKEELVSQAKAANASAATLEKMIEKLPASKSKTEIEEKLGEFRKKRSEIESKKAELKHAKAECSLALGQVEEKIKTQKAKQEKALELEQKLSQILAGKNAKQISEERANARKSLEGHMATIAQLEKEQENLEKIIKTLEIGEGSKCPVCQSPLDEKHRKQLESEYKKGIEEIGKKMLEEKKEAEKIRKNISQLEGIESQAAQISAQIGALGEIADISSLEQEKLKISQREKEIGEKIAKAEAELEKLMEEEGQAKRMLEQVMQAEKWKKELEDLRKNAKGMEEKAAAIAFDEKAYLSLKEKREKMLAEKAAVLEAVKSLQRLAAQDEQMLKMQQAMIDELEKAKKEAEKIRQEMDELAIFRSALSSTQAALRERLIGDLNAALARLWPLLYPYGDWSKVRLVGSEKDYYVEIMQGEWRSLEAHASGGERACLGLALRVALSVLLTPTLGWIILDEPTHNLDAKTVQTLGVALAEKIPQIVPQVIVITHEQQLVESTPGRVIRFSRDKLKGEDTRVEVEGGEG